MTPQVIIGEIDFHAVGQGLFTTGSLQTEQSSAMFRWVYDCGTTSKGNLLRHAIDTITKERANEGPRPRLDLVFVSHFDKDHISGLTALLEKFKVGTLVLPYMPLAQRMALALIEGIDTRQETMEFFVNPVRYLAGRDGVEIEQIVLVPGSVDETAREDGDEGGTPEAEGDSPWGLIVDAAQPRDKDQVDDLESFRTSAPDSTVQLLRVGGRLRTGRIWEFVPYNDAEVEPRPTAGFRKVVNLQRDALLASVSEPRRTRALASIQRIYDRHFGSSHKKRNEISLFVYGGAIGMRTRGGPYPIELCQGNTVHHRSEVRRHYPDPPASTPGILYTGDGFLDKKSRLHRLTQYLGNHRLSSIYLMQVMHHGAERNWHRGVAAAFSPNVSVFSSDPDHKSFGHPHAEVVRDFLPYGPVQVDTCRSISCHFALSLR